MQSIKDGVAEALNIYDKVKLQKNWKEKLISRLRSMHWKVDKPAADKLIAIKGLVVVKWMSPHWRFSKRAIREEINIQKLLRRKFLGQYIPETYAIRGKSLIVQRKLKVYTGSDYSIIQKVRKDLQDKNIEIGDLHYGNIMLYKGKPKIIDGELRRW